MNAPGAAPRPYSGKIRAKFAAATAQNGARIEFVGASDETIGEAVRRALARASESLQTLEGVGVLVIPQIYRNGPAPRYRVTLQITACEPTPDAVSASSPPK